MVYIVLIILYFILILNYELLVFSYVLFRYIGVSNRLFHYFDFFPVTDYSLLTIISFVDYRLDFDVDSIQFSLYVIIGWYL